MAMNKVQREYLKRKILTEDLGGLWREDQIWLAPEEWEMPWEAVMMNKVYFRAMWGLDVAGGRELCLLQWNMCRWVRSWVRPELLMGWWGVSSLESYPFYFKRKFIIHSFVSTYTIQPRTHHSHGTLQRLPVNPSCFCFCP